MKASVYIFSMLIVFALVLSVAGPVSASDTSLQLFEGGDSPDGLAPGQTTYNVFYEVTKTFSYSGGPVCLSSQPGQCTPPAIDDYVMIYVNGELVVDYRSYTHEFGPVDITPFLRNGDNQIQVRLIDLIGPSRGGSALWLSASESSENGMLQVNSVRGPVDGFFIIAKMGGPYTMEVEVHNPTTSRLTGTVHLEETGNVGGGDSLSVPKEQTVTLEPGETQYVKFANYVHKWNWMEDVTNDCLDAGSIINRSPCRFLVNSVK